MADERSLGPLLPVHVCGDAEVWPQALFPMRAFETSDCSLDCLENVAMEHTSCRHFVACHYLRSSFQFLSRFQSGFLLGGSIQYDSFGLSQRWKTRSLPQIEYVA